jgi:hypothetical protein
MLLAGCASPGGAGAHAGQTYMVSAPRTLFYSFGPAQATGPDFALPHGQLLTMLSYEYGYSHVAIQGAGESGYVPTEDVSPAAASAARPAPAASPAARRRHSLPNATNATNANIQPPVPLPEFPETEPPPGTPPFRY